MRHAFTQDAAFGQDDSARNLTPQGISDALSAGEWLKKTGWVPEVIYVSEAARTRQTISSILTVLPEWENKVRFVPELYHASARQLETFIAGNIPENIASVMIVAHNPGLSELVWELGHHFTPGTVMICEAAIKDWHEYSSRTMKCSTFFIPEK